MWSELANAQLVTIAVNDDLGLDKAQYYDETDPAISLKKHKLKKGRLIDVHVPLKIKFKIKLLPNL